MFISRSQDKHICRLRYLETKTPGCEQTSVRAGDLNDLSTSWEEVYLPYSLKIITIKLILTHRSSYSTTVQEKRLFVPWGRP